VVDGEGQIVQANAQAEKLFGYSRQELIGRQVETLIPNRFRARHLGHRESYLREPRARPMGADLELSARRRDGSEFPVDIMLSPVTAGEDRLVLGVVRDVTERKRAEAQAREVVRRDALLKEIHHRVKNNLQVISSLLYLQSIRVSDPEVQQMLVESQSRVRSIALIHEKLYRSEDLQKLDLGEYVGDLLANLVYTYGVDQEAVAVHVDIAGVHLGIDTAIPCGLIINELVSNAFKHAFPSGGRGSVWVEVRPAAAHGYDLTVRDDGAGLPPGLDWRRAKSLGLQLVNDLTKQLDGTIEVECRGGTTVRIRFSEPRAEGPREPV
jgi:PAS domain S-box-containing protein